MLALTRPSPATSITIDGRLDAAYGAPLSTQTTQTIRNDDFSQIDYCWGSELDEAYATVADGMLYVFLAGNIVFYWNGEAQTVWLPLDLFIDVGPGGQNVLLSNNPNFSSAYDLDQMAGLTFDEGFDADWWLSVGGKGDAGNWPHLSAYAAELPTGGGGTGQFLGGILCGGDGTITGGTNPFGIGVAVIDSNRAGVTQGCSPASGAGVTTGIEWAIPLAAIGNPAGCIKLCAIDGGCFDHSCILNQVLGPLPAGTCSTIPSGSVDFSTIPGQQYFSVCPTVGVGEPGPAKLAIRGVMPNPAKGELRVSLSLGDLEPATLEVFDVSGRKLEARRVEGMGPGWHTVTIGDPSMLPAGLYLVRLTQGRRSLTTRAAVVR
jgi:hypothetical protein